MATTYSPYSIELLPLDGILNPAASIDDLNGRLINTQTIIDGVLRAPHGLWSDLRELILNVRFHVISAIDLLDAYRRAGHQNKELVADAPGVSAAVDEHVRSLQAALPAWRNWLVDAMAQQPAATDPNFTPLPKLYNTTSAPEPGLTQSLLNSAAQPVGTIDYVSIGLVCLGLVGVASLFGWFSSKKEGKK